MENLISEIKNGKILSFSYSSYTAEAMFNISISYLPNKGLFHIKTIEKPAYHPEETMEEEKNEKELHDFLSAHADYIPHSKKAQQVDVTDANDGSERNEKKQETTTDDEVLKMLLSIKAGNKFTFYYISQREGGRFEYHISYLAQSGNFKVIEKSQLIFDEERTNENLHDEASLSLFLKNTKGYWHK